MYGKASADFNGANDFVGDGGFSLKESRYENESKIQLNRLDTGEEKTNEKHYEQPGSANGHSGRLDLLGRPVPGSKNRPHSEKYRRIQLYCYNFLERPRGLAIVYHVALCILVIVSLILTALSTVNIYEALLDTPIFIVEIVLVTVFIVEYGLRLWSAGCRSTYVGLRGRLNFAKKTYAILDVLVIFSSIAGLALSTNGSSITVRLVRFLPLLRVLRFDRQGSTWKLLASVIYIHRKELLTTLYLGFISLIFASFVLYMVEKDENVKFDSWPNSFWWGIVTLTTIGYGDKTPITWYGRLCASIFAVCGISFFALPAGILGSGFALKVTQQQRQKHFHRRRRPAAILLQSYWRMYCADINSKSVATWLPHIYYHKPTVNSIPSGADKPFSSIGVESPVVQPRKGRKLSAVWKNRNEGKTSRSQSAEIARVGKPDSLENFRKGSLASTLDTGFFDEANISTSEDGEPAISLSNAQKHAIRLIRLLKLKVAVRKFKEARRPYDVKDVIEQYSTGHVEMLARMRSLQQRVEKLPGTREGDDDLSKSDVINRLVKVEQQVTVLDHKVDVMLGLLTKMAALEGITQDSHFSYPRSPGPSPGGGSAFGVHPKVKRTFSDPQSETRTVNPISTNELPMVIVGADPLSDLPERCRSDTFPAPSASKNSEFPEYSQSFPILCLQKDSESSGVVNPLCSSSQSSDDSPGEMDHLIAPGSPPKSVFSRSRPGIHERQLSDVTEGDESITSESRENELHQSLSAELHLDAIGEDEKSDSEPNSPTETTRLGDSETRGSFGRPSERFSGDFGETSQRLPEDVTDHIPLVWEKQDTDVRRRRRFPSTKTSSESSCGTLVADGSKDQSLDLVPGPLETPPQVGDNIHGTSYPEVPGASQDKGLIEEDPVSTLDDSVTSAGDSKAKRRQLQRTSPIEV
ncbi:potassium voltage-gated channel subfamily KQT member 1 isoform X2 [Nematostella vectensis]|uniref:potassium voltage-gated channel subfamily KQT member 1 isoform X2 n=1 Tax=Nematostella vectensis TaxID=45351 RepID=UPI00207742B8|nr:potassium voltage-gated channel subfamily KQT member 1 isoform X2 [Nematostella vectensis]